MSSSSSFYWASSDSIRWTDVVQGVTLENTEKPKCGKDDECLSIIKELEESERPLDISGMGADPKCRYVRPPVDLPICSVITPIYLP